MKPRIAVCVDHEPSLSGRWVRINCAIGENEPVPFATPQHTDDLIKKKIRRPIRLPEFTSSLKDAPGYLEGLLYLFDIGHAKEQALNRLFLQIEV